MNLLEFDSHYPKNPQTLGEKLRKARMDKGMTLKEVAALFGVSDASVINWEIRGKMPDVDNAEKVMNFLGKIKLDKQ